MRNTKHWGSKGFTLVELIIVVAILAILLAFAIPGFDGLKQTYQLKSSVNSVSSAIGWTRAQAIRLQTPMVIIPDASRGWSGGWKICKDSDNKGVCQEQVKVQPALSSAISSVGTSTNVQINLSGMISAVASIGTFQVGEKKRELYIEMSRIKERSPG